jgi:hypothetical protein
MKKDTRERFKHIGKRRKARRILFCVYTFKPFLSMHLSIVGFEDSLFVCVNAKSSQMEWLVDFD